MLLLKIFAPTPKKITQMQFLIFMTINRSMTDSWGRCHRNPSHRWTEDVSKEEKEEVRIRKEKGARRNLQFALGGLEGPSSYS